MTGLVPSKYLSQSSASVSVISTCLSPEYPLVFVRIISICRRDQYPISEILSSHRYLPKSPVCGPVISICSISNTVPSICPSPQVSAGISQIHQHLFLSSVLVQTPDINISHRHQDLPQSCVPSPEYLFSP